MKAVANIPNLLRLSFLLLAASASVSHGLAQCVVPPSGLISWWPGDGNAMDVQGSNHGALQNGATFASGLVGQAFGFDGVDDYLDYGAQASLNFGAGAGFSVDGWVKTTDAFGPIVAQRHSVSGAPAIFIGVGYNGVEANPGRLTALVRDDNASEFGLNWARVTGGLVNDGNWHFFALVRTGGTIELFLDGVSQGVSSSVESDGAITTNLRTFGSERRWVQVGFGSNDQQFLNGAVDEVDIYNRAVTAAEIQAIYNARSAGKCRELSATASMPHLAVAGGWETTITLVNTSLSTAQARLNFFDDNGNPLTLPLTFPQTSTSSGPLLASILDRILSPGAILVIKSTGPGTVPIVGWAQLLSNGAVSGVSIFRSNTGTTDQQVGVSFENRNANAYIFPFDNTGTFVTAVALANASGQAGNIGITIRDDTGALVSSNTIALVAHAHTSFVLPNSYGFTAGLRGTLEFDAPAGGQITTLGILFNNATRAFGNIPVLTK